MIDSFSDQDHSLMTRALEEAKKAETRGEVPIGALIIDNQGNTLAQDSNRTRAQNDPCAHAEILCIRAACEKAGAQRIPDTTLYVTLEPCAMCAAALSFARVKRIVIAATDPKGGGVLHGGKFYEQPTCHHKPNVEHGLMADQGSKILKEFFKARR